MIRILVSACLLGEPVRYDGGHLQGHHDHLDRWQNERRLIPVCPEVAGGLPVPRPPAEIRGGSGDEVLDGTAFVIEDTGRDASAEFLTGAQKALEQARTNNVRLAILTDHSPSCGPDGIYDGSFSGTIRPGPSVTAALLERHGIRVFSQHQLDRAAAYLHGLETGF